MRSETFQTPAPPRLRITVPSGEIDLETADVAETTVEIEGPNEDEARVELRGDVLVVEVAKKRLFSVRGNHVVRVNAPHGAHVEADVASADVVGRGRFGPVTVHSASGDVRFDQVDGSASVHTASGDVEIGAVAEESTIRSASGDVRVREAVAGATVNTASGDVDIGSVTRGDVAVHSASGDVRVGIRQGSKVFVDVSSMSGDTTSELELGEAMPQGDSPLVELRARTMSGDITVRRA